jgi:hypothetical protein
MYKFGDEIISDQDAQHSAELKGLTIEEWAKKTGWEFIEGKTTASETTTQVSGAETNTPAGDSSSGDISLESQKTNPYHLTLEDLQGSDTEVKNLLSRRLRAIGIGIDEAIPGLDAINLKSLTQKNASGRETFIQAREELFGSGKLASEENLKKINDFIDQYGDDNYADSLRGNITSSGKTAQNLYEEQQAIINAQTVTAEESKEWVKNKWLSKEGAIRRQRMINQQARGGVAIGNERESIVNIELTKKDFETEAEYKEYLDWKKSGEINVSEKRLDELQKLALAEKKDKASKSYVRNLSDKDRENVETISQYEARALEIELAEREGDLKNIKKDLKKEQDEINEAVKAFNANPTSEAEYNSLKKREAEYFVKLAKFEQKIAGFENLVESDETKLAFQAANDLSLDYSLLNKLGANFKKTAVDLGYGAWQIMNITAGVVTKGFTEEALEAGVKASEADFKDILTESAEEMAGFDTGVAFDDIFKGEDVFGNMVNWAANTSVQAIPSLTLAFTGPAAMPLFFLSGYGSTAADSAVKEYEAVSRMLENGKILELNKEYKNEVARLLSSGMDMMSAENTAYQSITEKYKDDESMRDVNFLITEEQGVELEKQMTADEEIVNIPAYKEIGLAAVAGAAEVIFERLGTYAILNGVNKVTSLAPTKREIFKSVLKSANQEGLTEGATEFANNFARMVIMGEDVNLFEGVAESYFGGVLIGGPLELKNAAPAMYAHMAHESMSASEIKQYKAKIKELGRLIGDQNLSTLLNPNIELPGNLAPATVELIREVQLEGELLQDQAIERLQNNLTAEEIIELGEINMRMRQVNTRLIKASNSSLSQAEVSATAASLQSKFDKLSDRREALLGDLATQKETGLTKANIRGSLAIKSASLLVSQNQLTLKKAQAEKEFDSLTPEEKSQKIAEAGGNEATARTNYFTDKNKTALEQNRIQAENLLKENGLEGKIFSKTDAEFRKLADAEFDKLSAQEKQGLTKESWFQSLNGLELGGNIYVNIDAAARNGKVGTFMHEAFHVMVKRTIGDGAANKAGEDLLRFLERNDAEAFAHIQNHLEVNYDFDGIKDAAYYEEALTALSDYLSEGNTVGLNAVSKINGFFNNVFKKTGKGLNLSDGASTFEFITRYSAKNRGEKSDAAISKFIQDNIKKEEEAEPETPVVELETQERAAASRTETAKASRTLTPEKATEIEDLLKKRNERKAQAEEIAKKFGVEPQADAVQQRIETRIREALSPLIGKIVTNRTKALYDPIAADARNNVSREDFQNSLRTEVEALAFEEYKEGKQDIEKFLINRAYLRANNLASRLGIESVDAGIKQDVTEAKGLTTEIETTKETKETPKYTSLTESKTVSPETKTKIKDKLKTVVRTQSARMDLSEGKNVSVRKYIKNIRDGVGNLAWDIIRQDTMYSENAKGKLSLDQAKIRKFLSSKGLFIAQNLTTTTLQVKMPQLVQKKLAETGEFVSYPDWVGKKIARASVETKGREGKTSGDFEVRRLSDAQMRAQAKIDGKPVKNLNVAQLAVLEYMFDNVGINAAGNVEVSGLKRANPKALSKDLAAEAAFEILNEELQNPESEVRQAFKDNQEGLGVALTENFVTEVARDAERGSAKYSLTLQNTESTLRSKEFMSNISKLAKAVQTGTNTIEDVIENGVINEELVKKLNIPELFKEDLATLLQNAYDNGILDGGSGIKFMQYINKSEIIPNEDIPNSALTKRSPIEQLTEYAADVVKIGQKLGKEVMDASDVQLLGFFNRLLDPAKKKKDTGKPARFYGTLQTMLNSLRSKAVPANLNLEKVSLMNKNKGLMQQVAKIQAMNISKSEKLKLFKEQGLDKKIQQANINNKLLLKHIVKTMITMVKNGDINAKSYLQLLQAQTNAVNGLRALSGLTFITFKNGPQGNMKGEHLADNAGTMGRLAELAYENLSDANLDAAIEEAIDSHDQWLENRETLDFIDVYGKNNPNKEQRILGLPGGLNNVYYIDGRLAKNVIPEITQRRKNKQSFNNSVNKESLQDAKETIKEIESTPRAKLSRSKREPLDQRFNEILERKTGIEAFKSFSDVQAEIRGRKKGKFKFFIAPAVDDFRGLVNYAFSGKGKQGEIDKQWLEDNLMTPYAKGISAIEGIRQQIKRDFKAAVKASPKQYQLLNKTIGTSPFTYDHAVRVYLWQKAGFDTIPGLSKKDTKVLQDAIQVQPELMEFANSLLAVARRDEWMPPTEHWVGGTVLSDLNGMTEKIGRKKYLEEFIANAEVIFSNENLNKIEAAFGKNHREAIEDALYSMINGTNRSTGASQNKTVGKWLNWINGSTGAIMFFNRRSALLQMLSTVNFINYSDNNPVKAAAAFANQKQYWKDFAMIFNSDKLRERRGGLKQDVSSDEIANIANKNNRSPQAVLAYLLKIGFTPTQLADSMAIASGGATFYRNRVNTYVKGGMNQAAAEKQAFLDFSKISDETQQSSDPALVSQVQRSVLGRIVFAFQNTPMQMTRLMKKDALDLINGRGDWRVKVARIAYYGAIQNAIFSSLQSALFALIPGFDDEDDEDLTEEELAKRNTLEEGKITRALNSMLDTLLRGSGVYGAILASAKNVIREYNKQEAKGFLGDHSYTILSLFDISPPIGSKARKINTAIKTRTFEKDAIAERGWAVTAEGRLNLGPNWSILGNVVSATTNVPLDRVIAELTSIAEAFNAKNTAWQRVALAAGWKTWDVGVENEVNERIKEEAQIRRKEEGIIKAAETRKRKKQEEKERVAALTPEQKAAEEAVKEKAREEKRKERNAERQETINDNTIVDEDRIKDLTKAQQQQLLEDLGVMFVLIDDYKTEQDRVDKIIELRSKIK